MKKIIGICLVRSEDIYLKRIINNIIDFCDEIIITDNMSIDNTFKIIEKLASRYPKIVYKRISHPRESHQLIEKYVGTKTWVFGIDGDEIYDPSALLKTKEKLLSGYHDKWWLILGSVLNCISLNIENMKVKGYLAPPCRSMTKLYDFSIISKWTNCSIERLHGGDVEFKSGYNIALRYNLFERLSWEDSWFRCLHVALMKRSSIEKQNAGYRKPPSEIVPFLGIKGKYRYLKHKLKGRKHKSRMENETLHERCTR